MYSPANLMSLRDGKPSQSPKKSISAVDSLKSKAPAWSFGRGRDDMQLLKEPKPDLPKKPTTLTPYRLLTRGYFSDPYSVSPSHLESKGTEQLVMVSSLSHLMENYTLPPTVFEHTVLVKPITMLAMRTTSKRKALYKSRARSSTDASTFYSQSTPKLHSVLNREKKIDTQRPRSSTKTLYQKGKEQKFTSRIIAEEDEGIPERKRSSTKVNERPRGVDSRIRSYPKGNLNKLEKSQHGIIAEDDEEIPERKRSSTKVNERSRGVDSRIRSYPKGNLNKLEKSQQGIIDEEDEIFTKHTDRSRSYTKINDRKQPSSRSLKNLSIQSGRRFKNALMEDAIAEEDENYLISLERDRAYSKPSHNKQIASLGNTNMQMKTVKHQNEGGNQPKSQRNNEKIDFINEKDISYKNEIEIVNDEVQRGKYKSTDTKNVKTPAKKTNINAKPFSMHTISGKNIKNNSYNIKSPNSSLNKSSSQARINPGNTKRRDLRTKDQIITEEQNELVSISTKNRIKNEESIPMGSLMAKEETRPPVHSQKNQKTKNSSNSQVKRDNILNLSASKRTKKTGNLAKDKKEQIDDELDDINAQIDSIDKRIENYDSCILDHSRNIEEIDDNLSDYQKYLVNTLSSKNSEDDSSKAQTIINRENDLLDTSSPDKLHKHKAFPPGNHSSTLIKPIDYSPGPPSYSINYNDSAPAFSFAKQAKFFKQKSLITAVPGKDKRGKEYSLPGPGMYTPVLRDASPAYSFKKS